jgi:hypothetical protein
MSEGWQIVDLACIERQEGAPSIPAVEPLHARLRVVLNIPLGGNRKAVISIMAYATAILLSFWNGWLACAVYALIAIAWLTPDSRIERYIERAR